MLGASTRLKISPAEAAVLDRAMATFGQAVREAWSHVRREPGCKLDAWLKNHPVLRLPSVYREAVTTRVAQLQTEAVGQHAWRTASEEIRASALADHVKRLDRRLMALKKEAESLSRRGIAHTFAKTERLATVQGLITRLMARRFQKNRKRLATLDRLAALRARDPLSERVFGSRHLLAQRHRIGQKDSPFPTLEAWRQEWDRRRHGEIWLVGGGAESAGNQGGQHHPDSNPDQATFTLRLPDDQAEERLAAEAERLGISVDQVPGKLQFKRLILNHVVFPKKLQTQIARAQSLGIPITVHVKKQLTPKGRAQQARKHPSPEIGYYLHLAYDLPWPDRVTSPAQGVLGVDLNAGHLAWAIADSTGNPMRAVGPNTGQRTGPLLFGTIPLDLQGLSAGQAKNAVRHAVKRLVELAEKYKVALAIEALDFSKRKAGAKEKGASYARMISSLRTAGFAAAMRSRCIKRGIPLVPVNPRWTSVAGYAKYGLRFGMSVDQAASFAIARIGLRAKRPTQTPLPTHAKTGNNLGKKLSPAFVRTLQARRDAKVFTYQEAVRLPAPVPPALQAKRKRHAKGCQTGSLTWENVREVVGWDRRNWANRLRGLPSPFSARRLPAPASVGESRRRPRNPAWDTVLGARSRGQLDSSGLKHKLASTG